MFEACRNSGFRITFDNGYAVSVQWGCGTYSDNHDDFDFTSSEEKSSKTAEIAVLKINENGLFDFVDPSKIIQCESDGMVAGYISPADVATLIFNVSRL